MDKLKNLFEDLLEKTRMKAKDIVSCLILCILCTTFVECCFNTKWKQVTRDEDMEQPPAKRSRGSSASCGNFASSYATPYHTMNQGVRAKYSEFPWLASIQTKRLGFFEQKCAGSIISQNYILTAAHCFYNWADSSKVPQKDITNYMRVVVGTANLNLSTGFRAQIRRIKYAWLKNKFEETDYTHKHDIAVVKLKTALNFYDCAAICPICLPNSIMQYPETIVLAGWGDKWSPSGSKLYKLSLVITRNKDCEQQLRHYNVDMSSSQMCSIVEKHVSCIDDVGGPAMSQVGKHMHLIGIVSYQNICHGGVVLYTKVKKYVKWIRKVVGKMENGHAPPI